MAEAAQPGWKAAAAEAVVRGFIPSGSVVALGSGELVNSVVACLGARLMDKQLENVTVLPASSAAAHEAAFHGVPLAALEDAQHVDVLVDQADQLDEAAGAALKGIRAEPQQPELPRLRAALARAKQVVLLAEAQDLVPRLCASLPIFIDGAEWEGPAEALDDLFLGDAEVWRRPASGVANPRGGDNPYVSPEGANIVDIRFYEGFKLFGEDASYDKIAAEVGAIEGVLATGLLLGAADVLVVADPDAEAPRVVRCQRAAAAAAAAASTATAAS